MKNKAMKVSATSVLALMVIGGLAMPANAVDPGVPTSPHDSYLVVNLGVLGDVFGVLCLTGDAIEDGYVEVGVLDQGTDVGPLPLAMVGDLAGNVCLGGALGPFAGSDEGDFHVKSIDYVANGMAGSDRLGAVPFNGVDDVVGLELNVAFLARVQASYTSDATEVTTCTIGDPALPDVCIEEGDFGLSKNTHVMGVCGEATTDVEADEWAEDASFPAVAGSLSLQTQFFWDSPAFYLLDCVVGNPAINAAWKTAAQTVNTVTCNEFDTIPDTVCVFEDLPALASQCALDNAPPANNHVPIVGIVGEAGWDYTAAGICQGAAHISDSVWTNGQGSTIIIDEGTTLEPILELVLDNVPDETLVCVGIGTDGTFCPTTI